MKLFQWIIFFSILSGIFLLIYRRCNEKGFRKLWISLKIAVVIAGTLAGLLPENAEAQEFDHFQDNNQQVTLVARDSGGTPSNVPYNGGKPGQSPSNFPMSPAGGKPSPFVPTYRGVPKVVPGVGGGANPGGGGNGAVGSEFDGQCPVPKEKESKKSTNTNDGSVPKSNKKQSVEECELDENVKERKIEIVYRIKENPALVREAERTGKDQAAQKDVNHLIEQLSLGNDSPGLGNIRVKGLKNVSEARGRNEGRVYFREKDGKIEILGKSNKDNQKKVIAILQKMGY